MRSFDRVVLQEWLSLLRPGDLLAIALAIAGIVGSLLWLRAGGQADRAVIRVAGEVFGAYALGSAQVVRVPGALGDSIIEIEPGRARVAADPGPRQYCVRQGWLTQAGAVAICAPNQVTLSLSGGRVDYDSLSY